MADKERPINARLVFKPDKQSAEEAKKTISGIRQEFEKSTGSLEKMQKIGSTLTDIGVTMQGMGVGIIGLMIAGSQSYLRSMGMVEEQSAKWLYNSERIENVQIRIGRQLTEAINPGFEFAASSLEKIADIAEQNPWIAKAAAIGGAGLTGLGTLTGLAGAGMNISAGLQQMSNVGGAVGTLAKTTMAVSSVAILAGSVVLGAEVGVSLGNALNKMIQGDNYKEQNLGDALMTAQKLYQLPAMAGALALKETGVISPETASKFASAVDRWNSWLGNLFGATGSKSTSEGSYEPEALIKSGVVESFRAFTQQMSSAEESYEMQRRNVIDQYGQQRVQAEQQYQIQMSRAVRNFQTQQSYASQDFSISSSRAIRDFQISEARQEQAYYAQRSSLAASFHESIRRSEEDHQKQMMRDREDLSIELDDLNARRDAAGMRRAIRDAEIKRRRAEEDYDSESSRKSQDYARQIRELERNFRDQRALRVEDFMRRQADQREDFARRRERELANFQIQMADAAADHEARQKLLQENQDQTLKQLKEGYDMQIKMMREAFIDRIRALDPIILGDYNEYQRYLAGMSTQFRAWMSSQASFLPSTSTSLRPTPSIGSAPTPIRSGTTTSVKSGKGDSLGNRQFGGYAWSQGQYELAESGKREFVMDHDLTRLAEDKTGGSLTKSKIAGLLSKDSRSSQGISVSQSFEFHGSFSDEEKRWFSERMGSIAKDSTMSVLRKVVPIS